MRRGFQAEARVKVTKENVKELIQAEKTKSEENKRVLQQLMNRDIATTALLHQQAAQSHALWHDITDIREGRLEKPELQTLRTQIREVFLDGVRTNVITSIASLANLEDSELGKFMQLLKDKRNGHEVNFVENIPFFKYEAEKRTNTDEICAVCHEGYEEGVECIELDCKHVFHRKCITQWLKMKRNCPMCKHEVKKPKPRTNDQNVSTENLPSVPPVPRR